jgi:hypothetical protein
MVGGMDTAVSVIFYTIFFASVLFSYICQLVVPGTASLVKDEKGSALLNRDINTFSFANLSLPDLDGCSPWDHSITDIPQPLFY